MLGSSLKTMKTYRFYVKLYRDVNAENPEEAQKKLDEAMADDRDKYDDMLHHFVIIEGTRDTTPQLITDY